VTTDLQDALDLVEDLRNWPQLPEAGPDAGV